MFGFFNCWCGNYICPCIWGIWATTYWRKEERPFLSGGGEESFSTTFSHPTKQLLSGLPFSAPGASSCPLLGVVPCCCFLPWDTMHQDADSSEFPLSAFAALISVTLETSPCWIPFPLTLFLLVSHSFWHSLLTSYGGPKQNGRRRTTIDRKHLLKHVSVSKFYKDNLLSIL